AYVFLVGVGYFENDEFRVRQFFLYDPACEAEMLHAISALVQRFSVLVTFNGKGFDVPMLGARYWSHGQGHAQRYLAGMPHLDLLYPARRLWKDRLRSVRLANLERTLLGIRRTGDVAGAEIPELYLRYLHDGAVERLLPVFYHNAQDLLTLATLASHAASVYSDPFSGLVRDGLDFLCVGRAYEAAGDTENAIRAYDRALSLSLHPAAQLDACKRITPLYKRTARHNHAVALWEEMVTSEQQRSILPYEELAKHCEHVLGDLRRAESLVIQALRLLPLDTCTRTSVRDLEKRLRRIQAKLAALPVSAAPAGESR
ncbi:MAG: ribonuclease H-like domain-containing protein, partial [Chloroflexota bacterium]|nr:ribonuclease H-like domain-containing protein [Chloroflexota bacterium]